MKRFTTQILFGAAALTVVAMSASAQINMTAEIPFSFQAGSYMQAPGAYEVKIPDGSRHVILKNTDTGKSAFVVTASTVYPPPAAPRDGRALLRFDCQGGRCVLRQVWSGGDGRGVNVPGPKLGREEAITAREVMLTKATTK